MFARVVAPFPGRIAAMIGAKNQQVVFLHFAKQLGQTLIEIFQCRRVTRHIAPVAIEHVEVDEIRKHDRPIAGLLHCLQRGIEQGLVAAGFHLVGDALVRLNIGNLANADDIAA